MSSTRIKTSLRPTIFKALASVLLILFSVEVAHADPDWGVLFDVAAGLGMLIIGPIVFILLLIQTRKKRIHIVPISILLGVGLVWGLLVYHTSNYESVWAGTLVVGCAITWGIGMVLARKFPLNPKS